MPVALTLSIQRMVPTLARLAQQATGAPIPPWPHHTSVVQAIILRKALNRALCARLATFVILPRPRQLHMKPTSVMVTIVRSSQMRSTRNQTVEKVITAHQILKCRSPVPEEPTETTQQVHYQQLSLIVRTLPKEATLTEKA